jgi:hypothetical protein
VFPIRNQAKWCLRPVIRAEHLAFGEPAANLFFCAEAKGCALIDVLTRHRLPLKKMG